MMTYPIHLETQTVGNFNLLQYYLLPLYIKRESESSNQRSVVRELTILSFDDEITSHHHSDCHPWCRSFPGCTYSGSGCPGGKAMLLERVQEDRLK